VLVEEEEPEGLHRPVAGRVAAITGELYKLKPEQVLATLSQSTAAVGQHDDVMVVAVVLHADPEWERIGALTPE
jgi:hypothetical protein